MGESRGQGWGGGCLRTGLRLQVLWQLWWLLLQGGRDLVKENTPKLWTKGGVLAGLNRFGNITALMSGRLWQHLPGANVWRFKGIGFWAAEIFLSEKQKIKENHGVRSLCLRAPWGLAGQRNQFCLTPRTPKMVCNPNTSSCIKSSCALCVATQDPQKGCIDLPISDYFVS